MSNAEDWKVCSSCKTGIAHGQDYFRCSVSTCQHKRTGLFFCSVPCFEAHLPGMRHRDAWAEKERAPSKTQVLAEAQRQEAAERDQAERRPQRRTVGAGTSPAPQGSKEVLVVVSKLKRFIKDQSEMSTSDTAMPVLSDHLRQLSVAALRIAAEDGRRTVMGRDFEGAIRRLRNGG